MGIAVEPPEPVKAYTEAFEDLLTKPQRDHVQEYLTGIIVSENKTVKGITEHIVRSGDQSSLNRALTQAPWDEQRVNKRRIEELQEHEATAWSEEGTTLIDDTAVPKTGEKMPGAAVMYNGAEDRLELCQKFVTLTYKDAETMYPIDFRQYFKEGTREAETYGFHTKRELAGALVRDAIEELGVPTNTWVFDSEYLCTEVVEPIREHDRYYIGKSQANRTIGIGVEGGYEKTYLNELAASLTPADLTKKVVKGDTYWTYRETVYMHSLHERVQVVISWEARAMEEDPFYLVTNNLYWEAKRIITVYGRRWDTETFYRDVKQRLGLKDCRLRSVRGTHRHWYLVFLAYSLLETRVVRSGVVEMFESSLDTVGERCDHVSRQVLTSLVTWICDRLRKAFKALRDKSTRFQITMRGIVNVLLRGVTS